MPSGRRRGPKQEGGGREGERTAGTASELGTDIGVGVETTVEVPNEQAKENQPYWGEGENRAGTTKTTMQDGGRKRQRQPLRPGQGQRGGKGLTSPAADVTDGEGPEERAASDADLFPAAGIQDDISGPDGRKETDVFTQTRAQMEEELQKSMAIGTGRFNPHPDEVEVREVRKGYARLLTAVKAKKGDLVRPDDTQLTNLLQDANVLLGHVHTTVDATLDSRFMALSADLGAEKVSKLAAGSMDFTLGDLCALLKEVLRRERTLPPTLTRSVGGSEETIGEGVERGWEAIGRVAMHHWRGVMTPDFMLGLISVPAQPRPSRTRTTSTPRERRVIAPVVQPSIINDDDQATSVTGTGVEATTNVIRVYQCLQQVAPIPFYKFITDPTSYARTVENLFYVSFLVHDNRVRLWWSAVVQGRGRRGTNAVEGQQPPPQQLMLGLADQPSHDDEAKVGEGAEVGGENDHDRHADQPSGTPKGEGIGPKHQAILGMTMRMWREQRDKYRLIEPIINLG